MRKEHVIVEAYKSLRVYESKVIRGFDKTKYMNVIALI